MQGYDIEDVFAAEAFEIRIPPGIYSISCDEKGITQFDYTPISEHGVN